MRPAADSRSASPPRAGWLPAPSSVPAAVDPEDKALIKGLARVRTQPARSSSLLPLLTPHRLKRPGAPSRRHDRTQSPCGRLSAYRPSTTHVPFPQTLLTAASLADRGAHPRQSGEEDGTCKGQTCTMMTWTFFEPS